MSLFPPTPKLGMVTRLLLTCFSLLLFPYSSFADFSGQVVSVLDGVLSKSSRKKGLVETPGAKACTQNLQYAFSREMKAAITHYDRDYLDMAFYHLSARISWANRSHSQVDAEGRLESPRPNNDHRPSWQDSWGVNLLTNPRCHWGILVVRTSILLFQRVRNASLLEMGY